MTISKDMPKTLGEMERLRRNKKEEEETTTTKGLKEMRTFGRNERYLTNENLLPTVNGETQPEILLGNDAILIAERDHSKTPSLVPSLKDKHTDQNNDHTVPIISRQYPPNLTVPHAPTVSHAHQSHPFLYTDANPSSCPPSMLCPTSLPSPTVKMSSTETNTDQTLQPSAPLDPCQLYPTVVANFTHPTPKKPSATLPASSLSPTSFSPKGADTTPPKTSPSSYSAQANSQWSLTHPAVQIALEKAHSNPTAVQPPSKSSNLIGPAPHTICFTPAQGPHANQPLPTSTKTAHPVQALIGPHALNQSPDLEDKVNLQGEGIVAGLIQGRAKRHVQKPNYLMDYVE